jgi:type IV pilus assembly protein PilM
MRPVFNDFLTEVQRSIGYFSSVHRDSRIAKIVGMGNGFKLPGLQKFIAQNLQLECQRLDDFRVLAGDAVIESPVFKEHVPTFAVAYGLAVQGLGLSTLRTTLLPPEIEQARMIRRKKPWVVATAATFLLGLTLSFFGQWLPWDTVHADEWDEPEKAAQDVTKNAGNMKNAFQGAKSQWESQRQTGENLVRNAEGRVRWLELLQAINASLPRGNANDDVALREQIMLTSIQMEHFPDLGFWWNNLLDVAREQAGEQSGPAGSGWVVTLDGYHFHHEEGNPGKQGHQYVMNTLVAGLRRPKAALPGKPPIDVGDLGISHVTIVRQPSTYRVDLESGQAVQAAGARVPGADPLRGGQGAAGAAAPLLTGVRTDFTVQFAFTPKGN